MATENSTAKPRFAFSVSVHDEYGQARIRAEIVTVTESGELHGVSWSIGGFDPGAEYDGLRVTAYVGDRAGMRTEDKGVWGLGVYYQPAPGRERQARPGHRPGVRPA